jgi:hypothetical protein
MSREIDALVAEKVMGWKWYRVVSTAVLCPPFRQAEWNRAGAWMYEPLPDGPGDLKRDDIDGIFFYDSSKGGHTMAHIREYSTDISAAWAVVEQMRERGYILTLSGHRKAPWRAQFADHGEACSDSPVMAICIAALKSIGAIGVEVP